MIPDPDRNPETPRAEAAPWERQEGETARAFAAFGMYRDMGPLRSIRKVAAAFYTELGEQVPEPSTVSSARVSQIATWSSVTTGNDWVTRAEAWDAYLDEVSRLEQIEAAKTMRSQYVTIAQSMRGRVAATLRTMSEKGNDLSITNLPKWLEVAQKIEAWARDVPGEIIETRDAEDTRDRKELGHEIIAALGDELAAKRDAKEATG